MGVNQQNHKCITGLILGGKFVYYYIVKLCFKQTFSNSNCSFLTE